jgi:hypothetical protein
MAKLTHSEDLDLDAKVTLDAVFRRNVLMRPGALALVDPSDRAAFTGSIPRRLNYAEADVAVTRLARRLRSLGLPEQSIVAIQLPNIVEAVLSLLAVQRAGMIAVPVPVLWRSSDLVSALRKIGPNAFITMTRFGDDRPAEVACEAAAEIFTLGFPCAFGTNPPDGVIPLDLDSHWPDNEPYLLPAVHTISADAFAIATFDTARNGAFAVGRTHCQWLAAGLAVLLEAQIASGDTIISTLPPTSLAGLASAFMPWLLIGGTLQLTNSYLAQTSLETAGTHLIAPATALTYLTNIVHNGVSTAIAVHRAPGSLGLDLSDANCDAIVDLQIFGEVGLTALRRIAKIMPSPIQIGEISAPAESKNAPIVIETKLLNDGTLAVRGAMVPTKPFLSSGQTNVAQLEFDIDGFVRTNLKCHVIGSAGLVIEAAPDGVLNIGGMRYGIDDLTMQVLKALPDSRVTKVSDAMLGTRVVIEVVNSLAATKTLDEAGLSRLIIDGVKEQSAARAAS